MVHEVTLLPDEESRTLTATVNGERDGLKQTEMVTLVVLKEIYDPEDLTPLRYRAARQIHPLAC